MRYFRPFESYTKCSILTRSTKKSNSGMIRMPMFTRCYFTIACRTGIFKINKYGGLNSLFVGVFFPIGSFSSSLSYFSAS